MILKFCTLKLTVRLSKGANASYGAVQIYKNNQLYTICDDHWTDVEAKVVCTSLGYEDGLAIPKSGFGHFNGTPIGVRNVQCKGDEDDLFKCSLTWDDKCPSKMYASVYCSNGTIMETGMLSYRLPIFHEFLCLSPKRSVPCNPVTSHSLIVLIVLTYNQNKECSQAL